MGQPQATDLFKLVAGATQGVPGSGTHYSVSWSEMIAGLAASLLITDIELADSLSIYGTAAVQDVGYFADAAQGALADTAIQQAALDAAIATRAAASHTHTLSEITDLGSLTITEAQISDLGSYLTDVTGQSIGNLSDVTLDTVGNGEILRYSSGQFINQTYGEAGISEVGHTHAIADVTNLQTTLDNKLEAADLSGYALTSYVDSQISSLIDAAPGTLDTLNEIAAALGDDPNFAATITSQLSLKAPLASPAFTGTPTAPTATGGTNTTQLATTAFVQSAISSLASALGDLSDVTITTVATGEVLVKTASGWENQTLAEAGIQSAGSYAAASHTHLIADITDFTDNSANWNTAHGWGDHGAAGYADGTNEANWNTAFGWGDHGAAGYLAASSYTAADVLAKLLTVDGAGSGVDADLLDGQQGSYYLDYNNLINTPVGGGTGDAVLADNETVTGSWSFDEAITLKGDLTGLIFQHTTPLYDWENYQEASGNLIWTISGTGGAEMRLFADGADHDGAGTYLQVGDKTVMTVAGGDFTGRVRIVNANWDNHLHLVRSTEDWRFAPSTDGTLNLIRSAGTGTPSFDVYHKLRVDGASIFVSNTAGNPDESGLWLHHNASAGYVRSNTGSLWLGTDSANAIGITGTGAYFQGHVENTVGNRFEIKVASGFDFDVTAAGQINTLELFQDTAGADAVMTFHVSGDYAVQFGLSGALNDLAVGGWSMGQVQYRIWHAGNHGSGSGLDADLLDGFDAQISNVVSTVVVRDGSGDIFGRYFHGSYMNMSHGASERNSDTVFYSSTDNYIRKNTAAGMRTSLNVPHLSAAGGNSFTHTSGYGITLNGSGNADGYRVNLAAGTANNYFYGAQGANFLFNMYSDASDNARFNLGSGGASTIQLNAGGTSVFGTSTTSTAPLRVQQAGGNYDHLQFYSGTTRVGEIGAGDATWLRINQDTDKNIYTPRMIRADGGFQVDGIQIIEANGDFHAEDNMYVRWGNGNDLSIWSNGTNTYFQNSSGSITYWRNSSGTTKFLFHPTSNYIRLQDSVRLDFGNSNDFRIFHTGNNAYMDMYTGDLYIRDGSTNRFFFNDTGDFTATGNITAYGSISDIRFKEEVKPIKNALDKVMQLSGITYNYLGHKERMTGVIAQEVEKVLPEAVYELEPEAEEVMTGDKKLEGRKAVRQANMVGLLIEAIKELSMKVANLEAERGIQRGYN